MASNREDAEKTAQQLRQQDVERAVKQASSVIDDRLTDALRQGQDHIEHAVVLPHDPNAGLIMAALEAQYRAAGWQVGWARVRYGDLSYFFQPDAFWMTIIVAKDEAVLGKYLRTESWKQAALVLVLAVLALIFLMAGLSRLFAH